MIWINVCVKPLSLYDPRKLGWVRENDKWKPFWTDSPQAAKSYYELMKYGCKKGVSETANAVTQQKCMALCACGEDLDILVILSDAPKCWRALQNWRL